MHIGVFDSGLGGLTILKAITEILPQYDYIYYGDTASLPLGDKGEEEVYELTKRGVEELFKRDCLLVVVACNTASAETVRRLQDTFLKEEYPNRRILGAIVPTAEALSASGIRKALLLATKRTVDSGKYLRALAEKDIKVELSSKALPELVPLIEAGELDKALEIAKSAIAEYPNTEAIVLGCTHYTKLKESLRATFGVAQTSPLILSQDEIIPAKLADYLDRHSELETNLSRNHTRNIILTKHRPDYDQAIEQLLNGSTI